MKVKLLFLWVLILLSTSSICILHAQTAVTIGANYWNATMDYGGTGLEEIGLEIEPGNMFGPYLNLRLGKAVLGTSMFFGEFNFEFGDLFLSDISFSVKRTDMNFSLGYNLSRNVNVFGAYKLMKLKGESTFIDFWGQPQTYSVEDEFAYAGGGLSLMLPFADSPLFAFGSAAYLTYVGEEEGEDEEVTEIADIKAITAGLGFYSRSGLSIMVGYRADFSGEGEGEEKIHGIMATLAYTIR